MSQFEIKSIGMVESCYTDKFGTPRQPGLVKEAIAKIKIFPEFQPEESLQGLEGFTHVWILFWFHKNKDGHFHAKVHPPRLQGKSMGLFATRTPHRPNPIGLSVVELVKILHDGILVRGVDLISETPVLDIKPYLPEVEAISSAKQGWTSSLENSRFEISIEWTDEATAQLRDWNSKRNSRQEIKQLIENTIRLDPRPTVYKGYENSGDSPYRSEHTIRIYDGDVHFTFICENQVRVLRVLF